MKTVSSIRTQRLPILVSLFWICLLKCIYLLMLCLALKLWGKYEHFGILYWPQIANHVFLNHFIPYDGSFYLSLCENGYRAGARDCAFYPLWPAILKLASWLNVDGVIITGLILSNSLSVTAWLLLHQMVARRYGIKVAKWSLIFLIAFPGSLFYQFIYSESLFLFLLMGLWWGLESKRFALAFGLALLLPLSRPVGVFCVVPILWHLGTISRPNCWKRQKGLLAFLTQPTSVPGAQNAIAPPLAEPDALVSKSCEVDWRWLVVLAPICGWALYLSLMYIWTGNPFEGFAAQKYWGVHSISNLWNLPKFILAWFNPSSWHGFSGSLLDRCTFLLVIYCIPILWKIDKRLLAWLFVLGILPAMSGTFTSSTRYLSVAFPLFIALGFFFERTDRRLFRYCLLGVFVSLHATLVWRYVNFQWAN